MIPKSKFRFIVAVDVNGDSLGEAYATLVTRMTPPQGSPDDWESTDEAYGPDGESVDIAVLADACEQHWNLGGDEDD